MKRIVINSKIRHGKPIIEGTRITVDDVIGMLESGMSPKEIEKEYGLKKKDYFGALKGIGEFTRKDRAMGQLDQLN